MSGINLHEEWMKDPEYRQAHAEEELIVRVAIHVIRRRHELGLTQAQLAEKMGKGQAWIARVENGRENLTLRTVGKLAFALELEDGGQLTTPTEEPRAERGRRGRRDTVRGVGGSSAKDIP